MHEKVSAKMLERTDADPSQDPVKLDDGLVEFFGDMNLEVVNEEGSASRYLEAHRQEQQGE